MAHFFNADQPRRRPKPSPPRYIITSPIRRVSSLLLPLVLLVFFFFFASPNWSILCPTPTPSPSHLLPFPTSNFGCCSINFFSPLPAGWLLVAAYVSCRTALFGLFISDPLNLIRVVRGALCVCDCPWGPLEALRSRPSATLNPANPLNLSPPPLSNCHHCPASPRCWAYLHFNLSGPSVPFHMYTFFCCSFHFHWPS